LFEDHGGKDATIVREPALDIPYLMGLVVSGAQVFRNHLL